MKLIDGVQFLNIAFSFLLFGAAAVPVFGSVIVSLTCMNVCITVIKSMQPYH